MMMSAPLPDWMAAVMRGCRSLALMVSSWISAPRALPASGRSFSRRMTSHAGMKSFQRSRWIFVPWANAGARRAARIPSKPAAPAAAATRNCRRSITPSSRLVDLLELRLRPLHRVLGLRALDGLGVHVDDDVLRVRLRRLGGGRPGMAEHQRRSRRLSEHLQRLVDPGPHRAVFPLLRAADAVALVHLEPLAVVRVLVQPLEEVLGELLIL